ARAKALQEESERHLPLRLAHIIQRRTMAHHEDVDVAPFAPLVAVHRKERRRALLRAEGGEKRLSGILDRQSWDARRLDRAEAGGGWALANVVGGGGCGHVDASAVRFGPVCSTVVAPSM